jgi:hypothetical protein
MGGVFINYRYVDSPLGVAGIRQHLAGEFGPELIFRDCDSLAAGTHYPTASDAAAFACCWAPDTSSCAAQRQPNLSQHGDC